MSEIEIVAGALTRFAANFRATLQITGPPLYGEVRFNSSIPLSGASAPGDASPDPFVLQAQSPVAPDSFVLSNRISVVGINTPMAVSVSGGEDSLNGGAFTTAAGTADNGAEVVVRLRSSGTPGDSRSATLNIGDRSATVTVATYDPAAPISAFHYRSAKGDYIGQGLEFTYITPPNIITARRNVDNGVSFDVTGVHGANWTFELALPNDATPVPGRYASAGEYPFHGASQPGLKMAGEGRSCDSEGEFTIHEAAFALDGSVLSFSADFLQRCGPQEPPLRGAIRFNSHQLLASLQVPGGTQCVTREDFRPDMDNDGMPDCVEIARGHDRAVKDNDIFADDELFVMQQYRDVLGREGDEGGIEFWRSRVASLGRPEILRIFLRTPEFRETIGPVAALYFTYFLRVPDHAGLKFWAESLDSGNTLSAVSVSFARARSSTAATVRSATNGSSIASTTMSSAERPTVGAWPTGWVSPIRVESRVAISCWHSRSRRNIRP